MQASTKIDLIVEWHTSFLFDNNSLITFTTESSTAHPPQRLIVSVNVTLKFS